MGASVVLRKELKPLHSATYQTALIRIELGQDRKTSDRHRWPGASVLYLVSGARTFHQPAVCPTQRSESLVRPN